MVLRWSELDDAERDREYSPSSCLPDGDYVPFVEAYRRTSVDAWSWAEAADGVETSVVQYGDSESQTVDVAVPAGAAAVPLVVFFHGGYWQELSKLDSHFPVSACVARGWGYAAVDYTLAPAATLDEIVAECRRCLGVLRREGSSLGIDPDRLVLAGSSAGAHLAAMAALEPSSEGVVGVLLVSGIFELEPLIGTSINEQVGLDREAAARNSPLRADVSGFPAAIVAHGENETGEFKAQSHVFADHLTAAGAQATVVEIAGRNHFDVVLDLAEPDTRLGRALENLVQGEGQIDA